MNRGPTILAALVVLAVLLAQCGGCGGASAETRALYVAEQATCLANERAIVDRESTREEDERDLAAERARCDAALEAIYP